MLLLLLLFPPFPDWSQRKQLCPGPCPDAQTELSVGPFANSRTEIWIEKKHPKK